MLGSCNKDHAVKEPLNISSASLIELFELPNQKEAHNAFTDLVHFQDQFYICFRSSDKHVNGEDGVIKVYAASKSLFFNEILKFTVNGVDLRDPKFTIVDDKLHLYIHGTVFENGTAIGFKDYLSTFDEGTWSDLSEVYLRDVDQTYNEAWPWKVTYHNGSFFTVGYNQGVFSIYSSIDGVNFSEQLDLLPFIDYRPASEAIIKIVDNTYYLVSRVYQENAIILSSNDPLDSWQYLDDIPLKTFGGPEVEIFNNNNFLLSGRKNLDDGTQKLIISSYNLSESKFDELLVLPGEKDLGYPGMVLIDSNKLYVSYYSSDSGITTVKFAAISIETD